VNPYPSQVPCDGSSPMWRLQWRHSTTFRRADSVPEVYRGSGDACLDQLADEGSGQRLVGREMKGALGLAMALEVPGQSLQRRSTEGVVGTALRGRLEAGDDLSAEAKRRHPVADALLGSGNDGSYRLPNARSPARCQRRIVAGCTRRMAARHTGAMLAASDIVKRSHVRQLTRRPLSFLSATMSCCLSSAFSQTSAHRSRKTSLASPLRTEENHPFPTP
jgi:hypothetical protein